MPLSNAQTIHHTGRSVGQAARLDFEEAAGLETIDKLVARLKAAVRELTGAEIVGIAINAHRVPADVWHATEQPAKAMPHGQRPTHTAKDLYVSGSSYLSIWCAEDKDCADLIRAQIDWDAEERALALEAGIEPRTAA